MIANVGRLFANSSYATKIPIMHWTVPTVSPQVFKEELSINDFECGGHVDAAPMTYMAGVFTTVENKLFGVVAGSKVQLVVLNVNSPLGNPKFLTLTLNPTLPSR